MGDIKPVSLMGDSEIEDLMVEAMRRYFLKYSESVVDKYKGQITSAVKWYARSLPRHIASSESDDLLSEARIAFMESMKTWDPRKGELWTYASVRVKGAMQDYLRKRGNDPVTGLYEWITSAAYVYLAFNRDEIHHDAVDNTVQIEEAMEGLSDNEKVVINKYYKEDKTFKDIGDEIGLSESQVSRICKAATQKMKKRFVRT